MSVAFITRIVMSWDPKIRDESMPWLLAVLPTEPVLAPMRKIITPIGGVDITPIIGVATISFMNEILLGPQGILKLLQRGRVLACKCVCSICCPRARTRAHCVLLRSAHQLQPSPHASVLARLT